MIEIIDYPHKQVQCDHCGARVTVYKLRDAKADGWRRLKRAVRDPIRGAMEDLCPGCLVLHGPRRWPAAPTATPKERA